jgi:PAS domain S-box-containing protein
VGEWETTSAASQTSWLDYSPLVSIVLGYLLFLFGVAYAAERSRRLRTPRLQMLTYVLTASVYCTAWTFYGSVGLAAHRGLEFLTIYLGPALVALLWPFLLRRLVRVVKEQRITSVSDFIASRYGKSAPLGALAALLVSLGLIPYIALQLQAVSQSFKLILRQETILEWLDPALLVAVVLGVFGILFGARNPDFTRLQRGLLSAVAVESVVKLLAFLTVGAYVTWGLFDGFGDIFRRVLADPELSRLLTLGEPPAASFTRWSALLLISMLAVVFLPRQFHVLVVQNQDERHIAQASWMFPLYLFLINVFVLPIAFAGLMLLPRAQADHFVLLLPLSSGNQALSILVFLGGFSAATAMIVVDSLALSKMLTNDIVVPILLRNRSRDLYRASLTSMRLSILLVVALGYGWAIMAQGQFLLVEMGLLSFVAVTQCAPAILLGLVWPRGNRRGASVGLGLGFALWFYTLIVPALVKEGILPVSLLGDGPFGIDLLRPTAFLGLSGLDSVSHGLFWSLLANLGGYVLVSLATRQDAEERLQAAAFTGRFPSEGGTSVGRTILAPDEIERLVHHYVGGTEAAAIAGELLGTKRPEELTAPELLELRIRLEKRLAASLGAAAARFIVEDRFTLSKGEAEQLVESFQELQHSLRTTEEEVRRTERLLASVVRSVGDCIFTADVHGRLVTMNPAGERLFGAAEPHLVGAPWSRLFVSEDADGPHRLRPAAGSARPWQGEVRARARTGREFPVHLAVTPIVDLRGRVLGSVGVLRDLTEQHEMQRRLIQQEKLASLGQMAAGVAHEIRNPLGGIKMALGLLANVDGRDTLSREMIETMRSGILEIEAIISHLLDYTRDTRLDRQSYDLAQILRQVARACARDVGVRGMEVDWSGCRESVALVDGQRIRQVFTNVVRNAVEAAGRERIPQVAVRCERRNGVVVAEVVDNGVGMTPEEREKMFLPFFTTKPTGTGLGLAIVKKIVDLHGGEIQVESAPGRGTRVRIVLPAGVSDEATSPDRRG